MYSEGEQSYGRSRQNDLEERLISFGVQIIRMTAKMPRGPAGTHLSRQLLRSGTSPALNYAEARAAESHRDFTHKLKVVLKELRETWVNLRMVEGASIQPESVLLPIVLRESNELVAMFTEAVRKAERRSPPKS